jgi:hypothetical protein
MDTLPGKASKTIYARFAFDDIERTIPTAMARGYSSGSRGRRATCNVAEIRQDGSKA